MMNEVLHIFSIIQNYRHNLTQLHTQCNLQQYTTSIDVLPSKNQALCKHFKHICTVECKKVNIMYGTAQRQRRKRTQLFCDLRVRIECNECGLSMRTSLDFRIL